LAVTKTRKPETRKRKKKSWKPKKIKKKGGEKAGNGIFSHFWPETEKNDKILVGNGKKKL
jgi:hypothetical protein